jgi:DNA-binding XRE family transcriptional regulator
VTKALYMYSIISYASNIRLYCFMATALSRYASNALTLLADTIRMARVEQSMSQAVLAERAGISRALLSRIEHGDRGCAIGSVFEVAAILRVPLFGLDGPSLAQATARAADRLTLLPAVVRRPRTPVDDDF